MSSYYDTRVVVERFILTIVKHSSVFFVNVRYTKNDRVTALGPYPTVARCRELIAEIQAAEEKAKLERN